MSASITIAEARAAGATRLLVYCLGRRAGDWPCHHAGALPTERFRGEEALSTIARRCRCTACGWRRAEVRPDYGKVQAGPTSVGWWSRRECPLSRSLLGVKRTWPFALHISAFDPKRT
jgi:hypothetical protein